MNNTLTKSKVVFNPENHTYIYDGKQLSGVTSLLSALCLRTKYSGMMKILKACCLWYWECP